MLKNTVLAMTLALTPVAASANSLTDYVNRNGWGSLSPDTKNALSQIMGWSYGNNMFAGAKVVTVPNTHTYNLINYVRTYNKSAAVVNGDAERAGIEYYATGVVIINADGRRVWHSYTKRAYHRTGQYNDGTGSYIGSYGPYDMSIGPNGSIEFSPR